MSDATTQHRLAALEQQINKLLGRGQGLPSFSANPASWPNFVPIFRRDVGFAVYYDGTRWLSVHEEESALPPITVAANGNQIIVPHRTDFNPYITRVGVAWFVATTNSAASYWAFLLRSVTTSAYGGATNIHSDNTSGGAANTWSIGSAVPSTTQVPGTTYAFDISYSKAGGTGTPGNLTIAASIWWRHIVT